MLKERELTLGWSRLGSAPIPHREAASEHPKAQALWKLIPAEVSIEVIWPKLWGSLVILLFYEDVPFIPPVKKQNLEFSTLKNAIHVLHAKSENSINQKKFQIKYRFQCKKQNIASL